MEENKPQNPGQSPAKPQTPATETGGKDIKIDAETLGRFLGQIMRDVLNEELEKKLRYCRKLCLKYYEKCFGSQSSVSTGKYYGGKYKRTYNTNNSDYTKEYMGTRSSKTSSKQKSG